MAKKVLFINQKTTPYVTQSQMAEMGGVMSAKMQEAGFEIRTFMPKWSTINERRGQLHEVIRLSGMNLIIDDTDHPLIIKVASIPQSRIQVYFIDNEDYYQNRPVMTKDELGNDYPDNGERAIFFARGVLETVKKAPLAAGYHPLPRLDELGDTVLCEDGLPRRTAVYQRQGGDVALRRTARGRPGGRSSDALCRSGRPRPN